MVAETRRGLSGLANYAEEVQGDPERAARIRAKLEEVEDFLRTEGLSSIYDSRAQIDEARRNATEARRQQHTNHLAAVAQEAIRVEDGKFVHSTLTSVMRAVKARIADGSDPRLMSGFADKTLAHQVFVAGVDVDWIIRSNVFGQPIGDIISSPSFVQAVPSQGWRETLQYASQVLPTGTRPRDLAGLLMSFPTVAKYNLVEDRVIAVQTR